MISQVLQAGIWDFQMISRCYFQMILKLALTPLFTDPPLRHQGDAAQRHLGLRVPARRAADPICEFELRDADPSRVRHGGVQRA
jgi:hypothetical protein